MKYDVHIVSLGAEIIVATIEASDMMEAEREARRLYLNRIDPVTQSIEVHESVKEKH